MVLWFPKFWRMDGRRQTGSSLSRVLKRMELLEGPHGMYGTVFGEGGGRAGGQQQNRQLFSRKTVKVVGKKKELRRVSV